MKIPTANQSWLPLAGSLAIAASLLSPVLPLAGHSRALAQTPGAASQELPPVEELEARGCQYLREISTGTTHIRKQVQGSLGAGNSNTDFAIPTGTSFSSYIAMMIPENDANYTANINLKYPTGRADNVFSRNYPFSRWQLYTLEFRTPTREQPFQINLNVTSARNNAYTVAVIACQRD